MRVLAIGAHADDIEMGCGGSLINHRNDGDEIKLLVFTSSAYFDPITKNYREYGTIYDELVEASKVLNASHMCCGFEIHNLILTDSQIRRLQTEILDYKPDLIYCNSVNDSHPDHSAIGKMMRRYSRLCNKILMYKCSWYIGDEPIGINYYNDISSVFEDKTKLIQLYDSAAPNGGMKSWIECIELVNKYYGIMAGCMYAEGFEVLKWANIHM